MGNPSVTTPFDANGDKARMCFMYQDFAGATDSDYSSNPAWIFSNSEWEGVDVDAFVASALPHLGHFVPRVAPQKGNPRKS